MTPWPEQWLLVYPEGRGVVYNRPVGIDEQPWAVGVVHIHPDGTATVTRFGEADTMTDESDPRLERLDEIFASFDRMIDNITGLLIKARANVSFHQRMEDHLMDSLIEIAALGGPAGEVAAEALIVAWPEAGWDDNMNVMLTDYGRAINPAEWRRRRAAGELNWPHTHQGLDGWTASCDLDHVEFEVRPDSDGNT